MGRLIIVSGPIGSGKTAVARALVAAAAPPTAYIEGDVFWAFFARPPTNTPRQQRFQTIMRAMFRAAAAIAADDWDAILDFSMPPAFARAAAARAERIDVRYIELHASLETCAHRAATRAEGRITDYDAGFHAMFDAEPRFVVESGETAPEMVAQAIREGLEAGRFRLG